MAQNEFLNEFEKTTKLLIDQFQEEILSLRSSRPSASQVENIKVECYNSQSPLKHLASISIILPNIILIEPWDATIVSNIVQALNNSPLGVNPVIDGKQIKIILPPLSQERKEMLLKLLNSIKEQYRIRLRKAREEVITKIKESFEDKVISEDEKFRLLEEVQKMVEKINKTLDESAEKKEKEITES